MYNPPGPTLSTAETHRLASQGFCERLWSEVQRVESVGLRHAEQRQTKPEQR